MSPKKKRMHFLAQAGYVYISDHNLPMTRALGDLRLKVAQGRCWQETPACEQVVTAVPEVGVHARSADDLCAPPPYRPTYPPPAPHLPPYYPPPYPSALPPPPHPGASSSLPMGSLGA